MSVDNKGNKQWVWLALDAVTRERVGGEILSPPISREIVGVYIGARDEEGAQGMWDSLPGVYPRVFGGRILKLPPYFLSIK